MIDSSYRTRVLSVGLALAVYLGTTGVASAASSSKPVQTDPTAAGAALGAGLFLVVAGGLYQLVRG